MEVGVRERWHETSDTATRWSMSNETLSPVTPETTVGSVVRGISEPYLGLPLEAVDSRSGPISARPYRPPDVSALQVCSADDLSSRHFS
jgi:hypothetical protein